MDLVGSIKALRTEVVCTWQRMNDWRVHNRICMGQGEDREEYLGGDG